MLRTQQLTSGFTFGYRFLKLISLGLVCLFLVSCSEDPYDGQHWSESALAVIGGTILATEGDMHLVRQDYHMPPDLSTKIQRWLSPLPEAWATTACPLLTEGSSDIACNGNDLEIFYRNCVFPNRDNQRYGFWRTHSRIKDIGLAGGCAALVGGTKDFQHADFDGEVVRRVFGATPDGGSGGDENNYRISTTGTLAYLGTFFASGWYDSTPKGGMVITFSHSGATPVRQIDITGLQAREYSLSEELFKTVTNGFTLAQLKGGQAPTIDGSGIDFEGGQVSTSFDNTLDTQTIGSTGSGASATDTWEGIETGVYGNPIVVEGIGTSRTITSFKVRIQHNVSQVVVVAKTLPAELTARFAADGTSLDTTPIAWTHDAACCWPTQGEYLTNFYHTDNMTRDYRSTLTRFTSTCGQVQIRFYGSLNAVDGINEGSPQVHLLSHCF